ncbi:DNA helicase MCM8-like isoform X2 [Dinothrombium tinctorium]|uniref:DNA helicase MCM8 n=1 Tax=Dinothrombium tinctorium TaxID=1965070 RepID=A0A3S3SFU8_9ACAR|nr:DNA helicase MCM8-like isoform X2 [Dinothrombium tinctorium]
MNPNPKRKANWFLKNKFQKRDDDGEQSSPETEEKSKAKVGDYFVWNLYLREKDYDSRVEIVQKCERFLRRKPLTLEAVKDIEWKHSFVVSFVEISEFDESLVSFLNQEPSICLQCFALAMHQILICKAIEDEFNEHTYVLPPLNVRLIDYNVFAEIKQLSFQFYGKLVSVKGTVVKIESVRDICTKLCFKCTSCDKVTPVAQPNGRFRSIKKCKINECKGQLISLPYHPQTEISPLQMIKIQEIDDCASEQSGGLPITTLVELKDDLVNSCMLGDIITVSGIVKVLEPTTSFKDSKQKFDFYIEAVSIGNNKKAKVDFEEFSRSDINEFKSISQNKDVFRLLIASLNPSIYGYEVVKAGILLALFSGTQRYNDETKKIPLRGDIHLLIVGDPGVGKSQLLKAAANVAPKSSYVCGNTSTAAGLTVALTRDKSGNDFNIEGGALVMADGGLCCIDEFDKMKQQHQALLEAMERQTVTIAKAGFICSVSSRTSILAAANPFGGRYNRARTVSENLRIDSALLSRFDLIFVTIDKPNKQIDSKLSNHVVAMKHGFISDDNDISLIESSYFTGSEENTVKSNEVFVNKIRMTQSDNSYLIPHELMKKYIAYARKFVHPAIDNEAASLLRNFYLQLRKKSQSHCTPIVTIRQLESLIRLTEARARLELQESATAEHAKDVIEIFQQALIDTYMDEEGNFLIDRTVLGVGMSKRAQSKRFIEVLTKISENSGDKVFTFQQLKNIGKQCALDIADFSTFIENLNNAGYLLKQVDKRYKLVT